VQEAERKQPDWSIPKPFPAELLATQDTVSVADTGGKLGEFPIFVILVHFGMLQLFSNNFPHPF
jgi:hypothetical protein